jgi:hypothetical protein
LRRGRAVRQARALPNAPDGPIILPPDHRRLSRKILETVMKGRAVGDVQWAALRELREGEPPTFQRLAAAAELHHKTICERALFDGWEKQPYRRSGSRSSARPALGLPDIEMSPEELRGRLAAVLPRQLGRIVALAEQGRIDKAEIDALYSMVRVLERSEALSMEQAKEEKKRSDDELAGMLQLIDDRIVELAEAHAERLVQARDRDGMG